MKIVATTRTRNAETHIESFCMSYPMVDKILILDGGSTDNTVALAKQFKNVEIELFTETVERNGVERNPHGKHINALIDWATLEGADWIIFDDVDCIPNYCLKIYMRVIFEKSVKDVIYANRVYLYGRDQYFEKLTRPTGGRFTPSLWAWRPDMGLRFKEDDPFEHALNKEIEDECVHNLNPPFCLLHYFYLSDELMQKKLEFYRAIYERGAADPLDYGGDLLPLEDWMYR